MARSTAHLRLAHALLVAVCALVLGACDSCSCDTSPPGGEASSSAPSGGPSQAAADVAAQSQPRLPDDVFTGASVLLPRPDRLDRWRYLEAPANYRSEELHDLLGDEAAGYVALGVEEVAHARLRLTSPAEGSDSGASFSTADPVGLDIMLFRMSSPAAAQQRWDNDHRSVRCEQRDDLSSRHCLTPSGLDVQRGPWYMRFRLDAEAPQLAEPLVETARAVLAQMDDVMRRRRPVAPLGD